MVGQSSQQLRRPQPKVNKTPAKYTATKTNAYNTLATCRPANPKVNKALAKSKHDPNEPKVNNTLALCGPAKPKVNKTLTKSKPDPD